MTDLIISISETMNASPDLLKNKKLLEKLKTSREEIQYTAIREGHHVSMTFKGKEATINSTNLKSASLIISRGSNTLNEFINYCQGIEMSLELDGVINEKKGSIYWTDLFDLDNNSRLSTNDRINLYRVCHSLRLSAAPIIARDLASYDDIITFAINHFKENNIKGLNIRTCDNSKLNINIYNPNYKV